VYRVPFSEDRTLFATMLKEALQALRSEPDFPDDAQLSRIAISSFSAGFGAVREILKSQEYFDRIAGIYMVDSLYCGYVGDGTDNVQTGVVHPQLMKDFLRFARAAAEGDKVMIVTHCMEPTPGYASTLETADYLMQHLEIQPRFVDVVVKLPHQADVLPGSLKLYRHAEKKGFSLDGSPGLGATDHVQHLRHMAYWLPKLPLDKRDVNADPP
jgi:hypothetical protein